MSATQPRSSSLDLRWLMAVRDVEALATGALVLVGDRLGWPVHVPGMLLLAAIFPLSNLLAARSDEPSAWLHRLLLVDVVALTGLLALGGGPVNPFSALYLLQVFLAALLTDLRWGAITYSAALLGYGALFWLPLPPAHGLAGHLSGMWLAFAVLGPFLGAAVLRLRRDAARAEGQRRQAEQRRQRSERLASLATLAAGAAHELSTPLSTIAVVAHELRHALAGNASLAEDAALIEDEVSRCREVLDQLAADAGAARGEPLQTLRPREVVRRALAPVAEAGRVVVGGEAAPRPLPPRALSRALRGLIRNALEASTEEVSVRIEDSPLRFVVEDRGIGLSPAVRERIGEPFFTTRGEGRGMGLGVFYARSLAEARGGRLSYEDADPGTRATLEFPP